MNIGSLNKRISYTVPGAKTTDGYGGQTRATGTTVTTWGNAKPLSQAKNLLYGLTAGERAYIFSFRYGSTTTMTNISTITYETRTFVIRQILEIDEAQSIIKVLASERTN